MALQTEDLEASTRAAVPAANEASERGPTPPNTPKRYVGDLAPHSRLPAVMEPHAVVQNTMEMVGRQDSGTTCFAMNS